MPAPAPFERRAVCARCRRPERVCYCRHLTSIETTTRIVLLQHPRERRVAIGTARMPVDDPFQGRVYVTTRVDVDEETLREIAELTGGQYFRATDTESLQAIWDEIDQLERTEIEVENFTQYEERFPLPLALGFLFLVTEVGLAQTVLRRLP